MNFSYSDAYSLQDYDITSWRHSCGVVLHDSHIFPEFLVRNIAVGNKHIDHVRLQNAANQANLEEFIEKLPLKYQTMVGTESVGLSRGQGQRIFISRALYKNPSFAFLDEATNSLDVHNEKIITENLLDFCKGK